MCGTLMDVLLQFVNRNAAFAEQEKRYDVEIKVAWDARQEVDLYLARDAGNVYFTVCEMDT